MSEKFEPQIFKRTEFVIQQAPGSFGYNLWIRDKSHEQVAYATTVEFRVIDNGMLLPDPVLKMHREELQLLMDELWRIGIRPTEEGTAGQLGAVKYHLEDMRRLLFDQLGVEK